MDPFPAHSKCVRVGDCSPEALPHLTGAQVRNVKKDLETAIQVEKKFSAQVETWQRRYDGGDTDAINWNAEAKINCWTMALKDVNAEQTRR